MLRITLGQENRIKVITKLPKPTKHMISRWLKVSDGDSTNYELFDSVCYCEIAKDHCELKNEKDKTK